MLSLDADEHIFKFLLNKFGVGNPRLVIFIFIIDLVHGSRFGHNITCMW